MKFIQIRFYLFFLLPVAQQKVIKSDTPSKYNKYRKFKREIIAKFRLGLVSQKAGHLYLVWFKENLFKWEGLHDR